MNVPVLGLHMPALQTRPPARSIVCDCEPCEAARLARFHRNCITIAKAALLLHAAVSLAALAVVVWQDGWL